MKTIIYCLTFLLFLPASITSQINIDYLYQDYMSIRRIHSTYWETIVGTPYEINDFSEAVIFFRNNSKPVSGNLRYNNLFDEMEMHQDNNEEFLIVKNKETIDSIIMHRRTYRYMFYDEGNDPQKGYLIQLYSGKYNLLVKRTREFQPEKPPKSGYEDYVPPSIIIKPEKFYVQFEGKLALLLPQSSKNIIRLFRENGFDLSSYAKNNRIRHDAESLIPLIVYCNKQ